PSLAHGALPLKPAPSGGQSLTARSGVLEMDRHGIPAASVPPHRRAGLRRTGVGTLVRRRTGCRPCGRTRSESPTGVASDRSVLRATPPFSPEADAAERPAWPVFRAAASLKRGRRVD